MIRVGYLNPINVTTTMQLNQSLDLKVGKLNTRITMKWKYEKFGRPTFKGKGKVST